MTLLPRFVRWQAPSTSACTLNPRPTCLLVATLFGAAIMSAFPLPALAIHRCQSAGKISYSDLPCPGSSLMRIDDPVRSTPTANEADTNQQRQAAELARLQQLRELRERQDQRIRDLAARGAAAREKKCHTLGLQRKWREEDLRDASLRQEANARKRLRRIEERYRDECR
ncbi:MAG: hypothetical protein RL404_335 [Pseudomonadota bacterium]